MSTKEIAENNITSEALSTEYVSPENCKFYRTENGFLGAEINGTDYKRVILARTMPLSMPDDYICISDVNKVELGIIENAKMFSPEQKELIDKELDIRYFSPVITEIKSVKEKFGHFYFDVLIGDFKKSFTVRDLSKNVRYHDSGFDIIDVDGNRFRILDFKAIPAKSRRKLEPYLY